MRGEKPLVMKQANRSARQGRASGLLAVISLATASLISINLTPSALAAPGQQPVPNTTTARDTAAVGAKVPALGDELTAFGAIRNGNRTGAIPPWTGGLVTVPPQWKPDTHIPDPYDEDGRWFTVTSGELARYRVRLSAGLQALLEIHPRSFEIPVFPTRRSAAAPQHIYDASLKNAQTAGLASNGLSVTGASVGIPFPLPANGRQAMWNHVLRWRGTSGTKIGATILPYSHGDQARSIQREDWMSPYAQALDGAPRSLLYRRTTLAPEAERGNALLLLGSLNPLESPFQAWYRKGEDGTPVRAGDFTYGTPDPTTDGIRTADMLDMFSGPLDRFDFRLVSRREMYVPYNAYRMNSPRLSAGDFLWQAHPNPEFMRYEMHRVWVVEAMLKSNFSHPMPRRTYYLDEDSWMIVMADHYDRSGRLVRYSEAHGVAYPQVPVFAPAFEITYDIPGQRYIVTGLDNEQKAPVFDRPMAAQSFTMDALRKKRGWTPSPDLDPSEP